MSELGDACQVVMISGKLIVTSAQLSLKMMLLMMKIYNTLYLGKWKGATSFKRFRDIKGEDYEFINICSEDPETLARIEKEMEAHNLLFAKLPDLCGGDGNTQYVVARSDMHIFAAFLMDHNHGELQNIKVGPIAESDYARTAVHPESGEYTQEFQDLNESARQQYAAARLQLTTVREEKPLQLPLFVSRTSDRVEAADVIDGEMPGRQLFPGTVDAAEYAQPERLMITQNGIREETTIVMLMMDPQIRLRNEILRSGNTVELIYEDPIREGERWAAFPVHDGDHIVVVPKEDLLGGYTTREQQFRASPVEKPPRAMLYTNKNYVVMDVRSGEKMICEGREIMDLMKAPALSLQKEQLTNLAQNIEKNVGAGAMVPAIPMKRGGR